MDEQALRQLPCMYKNSGVPYKSVGAVHAAAEKQVRAYASQMLSVDYDVVAFAVTQVVDCFVVTQVHCRRLNFFELSKVPPEGSAGVYSFCKS